MLENAFVKTLLKGGLLALLLVVGCSQRGPDSTLATLNESNIQRLANLYFAYQKLHDFQGPKDDQDFRQFVRGVSPDKLQRIGVDPSSLDSIFVSERDSQPFNIRFRVKGNIMGSNDPVIFESQGVDGKRMVGFLDMTQREVDAAEYDQLWGSKAVAGSSR